VYAGGRYGRRARDAGGGMWDVDAIFGSAKSYCYHTLENTQTT